MRDLLVVALGAGGVGAAIGTAATLAWHRAEPAPAASFDETSLADALERASSRGNAELRRELQRVVDRLVALRADAETAAPSVTSPSRDPTGDRTEPATSVRRRRDATDEASESPFRTLGPPAAYARFEALKDWDRRTELRRTWMFADEQTCVDWFGTPDEVHDGGDGTTLWAYAEPRPDADGDGMPDGTRNYGLFFRDGRLIRIDVESE